MLCGPKKVDPVFVIIELHLHRSTQLFGMHFFGKIKATIIGVLMFLLFFLGGFTVAIPWTALVPGFLLKSTFGQIASYISSELRGPVVVTLLLGILTYSLYRWIRYIRFVSRNALILKTWRIVIFFLLYGILFQNLSFFVDWMIWDLKIEEDEAILAVWRTWFLSCGIFLILGFLTDYLVSNHATYAIREIESTES